MKSGYWKCASTNGLIWKVSTNKNDHYEVNLLIRPPFFVQFFTFMKQFLWWAWYQSLMNFFFYLRVGKTKQDCNQKSLKGIDNTFNIQPHNFRCIVHAIWHCNRYHVIHAKQRYKDQRRANHPPIKGKLKKKSTLLSNKRS